jgi:hypothetical protein
MEEDPILKRLKRQVIALLGIAGAIAVGVAAYIEDWGQVTYYTICQMFQPAHDRIVG